MHSLGEDDTNCGHTAEGGVCSSVVRRRLWHELRRKVLYDATNNKRRIDGEGGVFHLQRCELGVGETFKKK